MAILGIYVRFLGGSFPGLLLWSFVETSNFAWDDALVMFPDLNSVAMTLDVRTLAKTLQHKPGKSAGGLFRDG